MLGGTGWAGLPRPWKGGFGRHPQQKAIGSEPSPARRWGQAFWQCGDLRAKKVPGWLASIE